MFLSLYDISESSYSKPFGLMCKGTLQILQLYFSQLIGLPISILNIVDIANLSLQLPTAIAASPNRRIVLEFEKDI